MKNNFDKIPAILMGVPSNGEERILYNELSILSHEEIYKRYSAFEPFMDDGNYLISYLKGRGLINKIGFVVRTLGNIHKKIPIYEFKSFLKLVDKENI